MIEAICVFGVIFLLFYWVRKPFTYWKNRNLPHPPVSYLFGNIGDTLFLRKSFHELYDEFYKKYDQLLYFGVYKGRTPCILIRDITIIKEVLVQNFNNFNVNEVFVDEKDDPLFAMNPFTSKGEAWKIRRNQLALSYTAKKIREMSPLIEAVAKNLIKHIATNTIGVNARDLFIKYTTDVVASCSLGLDANSFIDPDSEYIKIYNSIVPHTFIGKLKLFLIFNFSSLLKPFAYRFIGEQAETYYKTIVKKTIEYRKRNKIHRGDFLDTINEHRENNVPGDDITGYVVTFFVEGTETSSITLSFVMYELALNLEIQSKLRAEIEKTTKRFIGKLSFEAIQEMEYLDQILCENLRKNTPIPFLKKLCTQQCTLKSPDGKGSAITVEPGTPMIIPAYSIHNDHKHYPNPFVFDPERFSKENKEKRSGYLYLPFGEGPRKCPGQKFGFAQTKIAIAYIIANFEVRFHEKTVVPYKIDSKYFALEARDGIWLNFYKIH